MLPSERGEDGDDDDGGVGYDLDEGPVFGTFIKLTTCYHMSFYLFV